jgi:hypothetical protein
MALLIVFDLSRTTRLPLLLLLLLLLPLLFRSVSALENGDEIGRSDGASRLGLELAVGSGGAARRTGRSAEERVPFMICRRIFSSRVSRRAPRDSNSSTTGYKHKQRLSIPQPNSNSKRQSERDRETERARARMTYPVANLLGLFKS